MSPFRHFVDCLGCSLYNRYASGWRIPITTFAEVPVGFAAQTIIAVAPDTEDLVPPGSSRAERR